MRIININVEQISNGFVVEIFKENRMFPKGFKENRMFPKGLFRVATTFVPKLQDVKLEVTNFLDKI